MGCDIHDLEFHMISTGKVRNDVIVVDEPEMLPEGARVRVELIEALTPDALREGCWWKGQIELAYDFDDLPPEIEVAFGVSPS